MGEYEAKISVKNFAKERTNICYVNLDTKICLYDSLRFAIKTKSI